ncbi:MAG: selenide, water dikinase SelD [Thermomicrobiales bacterium]|nr:selenide, water dikinase SelD [Thermomicrobiales bacterium]MCO5222658.1 selenide, water dikinase SelD [Thermomicrobiales bacterium]
MVSSYERQRLTELASCAGCAAKMGPDRLAQALLPLTADTHPDLIVGLQTSDDAAVFRMTDEQAIVQTVDFFPPIVDDPYSYGAIAATNSMSDVFAMNGSVLLALSVAAFPAEMPIESITEIFQGAADKVREAGGIIAGGHTVIDEEPKYGLSVTGTVRPDRVWTKAGAQPGDTLILTKPLGTGLITTALKNGNVRDAHLAAAIGWMTTLNRAAQEAVTDLPINACSDITGFSLAGHSSEIAAKSNVRIELNTSAFPVLDGALDYAASGQIAGGLQRNLAHFLGERVHVSTSVPEVLKLLSFDPQTSGGLLLSVPAQSTGAVISRLESANVPQWQVGVVHDGAGVDIS